MNRTPMRRTAFKRKQPAHQPTVEREPRPLAKAYRRSSYSGTTTGAPIEKDAPVRSEAYRRLVAALPCWLCGVQGYSQAAHADQGKGLGIKSDDRTCYPACGPHGEDVGCHYAIGTAGAYRRDERRAMETLAGRETRERIWNSGQWPKNLPKWEET